MIKGLTNKIFSEQKYHFPIFLILLLALTALFHISYSPLCPGQDFHFHFSRFNALTDAFVDGSFPYYIDYHAVDGYGYLARLFYPDLILIPFAYIAQYTGPESAFKLMISALTLLCGIFSYMAVNKIYKNTTAATIAAILYTFCTYRLHDIFMRMALGEVMVFTFLPLVFLGLYHIIHGDYKKWYILAFGFSLVIYSHLISSVLLAIILVIFLIIYNKSIRKEMVRLKYLCFAALLALALTAYYIFPMLEQMLTSSFYYATNNKTLKVEDADYAINWLMWGIFGGGIQPRQLSIPGVGILLVVMVSLRLVIKGKDSKLRSADNLLIVGLVLLFACTKYFPWGWYPFKLLNFIQIAWRLLLFVSFLFAVAGGVYFSKVFVNAKRLAAASLLLIVGTAFIIINNADLYKAVRCQHEVYAETNVENNYLMGGLEYIPSKVPSIQYISDRGRGTITSQHDNTEISNVQRDGDVFSFNAHTLEKDIIELPLFYYVGYTANANGKEIKITESSNGLISVELEQSAEVKIQYAGTLIQKLSYWFSLGTLAIFVIFGIIRKIKNRKNA